MSNEQDEQAEQAEFERRQAAGELEPGYFIHHAITTRYIVFYEDNYGHGVEVANLSTAAEAETWIAEHTKEGE